jgi:hypothetical protein
MKACRFVPLAALVTAAALLLLSAQESRSEALASLSWSAATDFSPTANPNGVWSYGFIPASGLYTDFALYDLGGPAPDIPGLDAWRHTAGSSDPRVPAVAHNGGSSTLYAYGDLVLPPGEMHLHPGPEGQQSVVRFTAPFNGTFQIDVTFSVGDPPGWEGTTTTDVHVLKNGLSLFDGDVDGYVDPNDSEHYSAVQILAAGDIIDFTVGFGNGNYYYDTTFLDATILGSEGPIPTPTPVSPVGGIAELPPVGQGDSFAQSYIALAGITAALLALTAGAWYARRRWLG